MSRVLVKFVRDDGLEFLMDGDVWRITSTGLKGIDFPEFSLYTEPLATTDGSVITGSQIASRNVVVTAYNSNQKYNEQDRKNALKFFNVKKKYKLYITYMGITRWIEGVINTFSMPSKNIYRRLELKVMLFCKNPYWRSVDEFAKDIKGSAGRWGFPYIQTEKIKVIPSVVSFDKEVFLFNDGDVPTQMRVVMTFSGNVKNPYIQKEDKIFKMAKTFKKDDELIIDFANHTVTLNGENAMKYVDKVSSFNDMSIEVNGSAFIVNSDSGDTDISCIVYYNQLYGGM